MQRNLILTILGLCLVAPAFPQEKETQFAFNNYHRYYNEAWQRVFFSLRIFSKIRSPSCFILVTRNPPFISIQKLLYSNLLNNILYRSFIVKSLYVLIGKFRFFQFSKLKFVALIPVVNMFPISTVIPN